MKQWRKNLEKVFAQSDATERHAGMVAYPLYHDVLQEFSRHYNIPFESAVACFCALSPNNDYFKNLRSAVTLFAAFNERHPFERITSTTFGHATKRAWLYLNGVPFLDHAKGLKTRAFYQNILDPHNPRPVTIDGHMMNAAEQIKRPLIEVSLSVATYKELSNTVREMASYYGLIPNRLQGTLWFTWKRMCDSVAHERQLHLLSDDGVRITYTPDQITPYRLRPELFQPRLTEYVLQGNLYGAPDKV